jgi:hypothetical protein
MDHVLVVGIVDVVIHAIYVSKLEIFLVWKVPSDKLPLNGRMSERNSSVLNVDIYGNQKTLNISEPPMNI